MTKRINQKWVLAQRPTGEPTDDCFRLEEETVGELADGEILVQVHYLSLDPYMRGRMREGKSYAEPIQIGEIITGECAGVVIESRSPRWQEGDTLTVHEGWQSFAQQCYCKRADFAGPCVEGATPRAPLLALSRDPP